MAHPERQSSGGSNRTLIDVQKLSTTSEGQLWLIHDRSFETGRFLPHGGTIDDDPHDRLLKDRDEPLRTRPNQFAIRRKPLPLTTYAPIRSDPVRASNGSSYTPLPAAQEAWGSPAADYGAGHFEPLSRSASVISRTQHDIVLASPIRHSVPHRHSNSSSGEIDENQSKEQVVRSTSWMPTCLTTPYLVALIAFNTVLLTVVVFLHAWSHTHYGLGDTYNSKAIFFAWRFLPTLIAVIYSFWIMMVLEDVKRTDCHARLARGSGASARSSLFSSPGPWWTTLSRCFPGKQNDREWNLAMLYAVITYIFAFLAISPLSSTLLAPSSTKIVTAATFHRYDVGSADSLQPDLNALSFFDTTGNFLQNVSTSAWITDDYVILPMTPHSRADIVLGAALNMTGETWYGRSVVLKSQLECESFRLLRGPNSLNLTYFYVDYDGEPGNTTQNIVTVTLLSPSGCQYSFAYDDYAVFPRSWWADTTQSAGGAVGDDAVYATNHLYSSILFNTTQECDDGEVMIAFSELDFESGSRFCKQTFFAAEVDVTVTQNNDIAVAEPDYDEFERTKKPVNGTLIDTKAFQDTFLSARWEQQLDLGIAYNGTHSAFSGPSRLLGSRYNFDVMDMLKSDSLVKNAGILKQRAFGEAVLSAIGNASVVNVAGNQTSFENRVHVVGPVAYTIEVVLLLQLVLLVALLFATRLSIRPLGLSTDPALTSTIVAELDLTSCLTSELAKFHITRSVQVDEVLGSDRIHLVSDTLTIEPKDETASMKPENDSDLDSKRSHNLQWIPFYLKGSWLVFLLAFIASFLLAVAILYWYALDYGLYKSSLLYHRAILVGSTTIATFAPYSILPTLLAVTVGLWWGAIESEFRLLQPFLAMAKTRTQNKDGSSLSYRSSYLLWASFKALQRRHWLLSLVSCGAFFSQICK